MKAINYETLPVIHHGIDGHGRPETVTAAEWLGEPVALGRKLTDEEAARLSAYSGSTLANRLEHDAAAYVLEDAVGTVLHVYAVDPFDP